MVTDTSKANCLRVQCCQRKLRFCPGKVLVKETCTLPVAAVKALLGLGFTLMALVSSHSLIIYVAFGLLRLTRCL